MLDCAPRNVLILAPWFKRVDMGATKKFDVSGSKNIEVRVDVLNVFNTTNYGGFDDWVGGPGNPQNYLGGDNAHLGVPNDIASPMRTVKLSLRYLF